MLGLGKTKDPVGVDIGSHAIKAIELHSRKKGNDVLYEVTKIGYEVLPHDAIVEGTIIDSTAVVESLQHLFVNNKITNKNVVISLSGNSVIVKKISLPKMESEELAESIIWEAKHNIPYPFEETNVDYALLRPASGEEQENLDILLVAVKKEKISAYSSIITQAAKNLQAIEVDGFGLLNTFEINYPELFSDKTVALLNLGANLTNIVICEKGVPQIMRDLSLGGFFFTENMRKELNIPFEEAEKLLKGGTSANIAPKEFEAVLKQNTHDFLEEVEKTLSFYTAEDKRSKKIESIFLSGGLANLKSMVGAVEQKFDVATRILDPFRQITFNEKRLNPVFYQEMPVFFGVATGLACRRME
jgi:type IV pilus assembly protein PilM